MSVRGELRFDGDECSLCSSPLHQAESIDTEVVTYRRGEHAGMKVLAALCRCSNCGVTTALPWVVSP